MLPEHIDVDISTMLLSQNDHFLAEFEVYVCGIGVSRSQRGGGKRFTLWWLIVAEHPGAPEKSKITYGETEFDEVNPKPHLWSPTRLGYLQEGHSLLRDFIEMRKKSKAPPPPPPPRLLSMIVTCDFDGTEYGEEYLSSNSPRRVSSCGQSQRTLVASSKTRLPPRRTQSAARLHRDAEEIDGAPAASTATAASNACCL